DISVTGPNGFTATPTFVGVDNPTNGSPRTATYQFTPPGGAWANGNGGTYLINIHANQVAGMDRDFVPAGSVGPFHVLLTRPFLVTTKNDSGSGTLRPAVLD